MPTFSLSLITPEGKIFDGEVESVMASGANGFFGVLRNHAPMVISLTPGPLTVQTQGRRRFFAVSSGVLEVGEKGSVLLLADKAIPKDSLDAAKTDSTTFIPV